MDRGRIEEQIRALDEGEAFVRHEGMRIVRVVGGDARGWLHDLVTCDVSTLGAFEVRRALLLTPTGRIRADMHVMGSGDAGDGLVLAQPADQPRDLLELLRPYVLSSDVELEPAPFEVVSVPGPGAPPEACARVWRPSLLGDGFALLAASGELARDLRRLEAAGLVEARPEAAEARRIRLGVARFPVDLDEDSLPAEAGLDDEVVIDRTKGCFLGQESVAKVRNLGHPTRALLALRSSDPLGEGETVLAGDRDVGLLTSVDAGPEGWTAIARVRWEAWRDELRTASGALLRTP
jgi:folate-binding protein YgfZ